MPRSQVSIQDAAPRQPKSKAFWCLHAGEGQDEPGEGEAGAVAGGRGSNLR